MCVCIICIVYDWVCHVCVYLRRLVPLTGLVVKLRAVAMINPDLGILITFKCMSLKTGKPLMLNLVFVPHCHCSFA